MPMFYRVSNDVFCINPEPLLLLRDFHLILPGGEPGAHHDAMAQEIYRRWQDEPMSIDEVASAIAPQFGSGEAIRAAVRRQFLLAAPDCVEYNPDDRTAFANMVRWGSPNNAEYPVLDFEEQVMHFNTALSHPFALIRCLSRMFPDEAFKVTFAEENPGYNTGSYTISKGDYLSYERPADGSAAAYCLSFEHWGHSKDYVKNGERYELKRRTDEIASAD